MKTPVDTCGGRKSRTGNLALPRLGALHAQDSGQAMPMALVVLAVGVILVTVFTLAVGVYLKISSATAADLLEYYAADAGIESAIVPLAANPNAYPTSANLSLSLNGRQVSVAVAPLGSRVIPDPGGGMTATVTSYLVTSSSGSLAITARSEARQVSGQTPATVRITAWRVGK